MDGNGSRNNFLNKKLIIYQLPLFERTAFLLSAIFLTAIPVICLCLPNAYEDQTHIIFIVLLLAMIVYDIYIFFGVFKLYVCLDFKCNKLIVRERIGFKKWEVPLVNVKSLCVTEGQNGYFTFDVKVNSTNIKLKGFCETTFGRGGVPFNGYKRQTNRLKKFCDEVNLYLSQYNTNTSQ